VFSKNFSVFLDVPWMMVFKAHRTFLCLGPDLLQHQQSP